MGGCLGRPPSKTGRDFSFLLSKTMFHIYFPQTETPACRCPCTGGTRGASPPSSRWRSWRSWRSWRWGNTRHLLPLSPLQMSWLDHWRRCCRNQQAGAWSDMPQNILRWRIEENYIVNQPQEAFTETWRLIYFILINTINCSRYYQMK